MREKKIKYFEMNRATIEFAFWLFIFLRRLREVNDLL